MIEMLQNLRRVALPLIAVAAISGCAAKPAGPTSQPVAEGTLPGVVHLIDAPPPAGAAEEDRPKDAQRQVPAIIQMEIYQLSLPFGTLSQNEEFWKRIDEQCVDVATYDLLFKNGIRVGRAPGGEWPYFSELISSYPVHVVKTGVSGIEVKAVELEMKRDVAEQTLFFYDARNMLSGRTYEKCENLLSISFQPAPRKPGQVRVAMCPTVRTLRRKLEYTVMNDELPEIRLTFPERLYDLNLRADVPLDNFLVIAPSSEGKWPTSVGNAFLKKDGAAERLEQVILLVPRPYLIESPATADAGPNPKAR